MFDVKAERESGMSEKEGGEEYDGTARERGILVW